MKEFKNILMFVWCYIIWVGVCAAFILAFPITLTYIFYRTIKQSYKEFNEI